MLRKLFVLFLIIGILFTFCYIILQAVMFGLSAEVLRVSMGPGVGDIFAFRMWEWILGIPQPPEGMKKLVPVAATWNGAIYNGDMEALPYGWPSQFRYVSQGPRDGHMAVDLAGEYGAPIHSTMQGTVVGR